MNTIARFAIAGSTATAVVCGKTITIDACMLSHLEGWGLSIVRGHVRCQKRKDNVITRIYLHRLLTGCAEGMQVDHANQNPLDNRMCNLRVCTASENRRNTRGSSTRYSVFKGVYHDTGKDKPWRAYTSIGTKRIWFGSFDNEADAAVAYNNAVVGLFGAFACLNAVPGYTVPEPAAVVDATFNSAIGELDKCIDQAITLTKRCDAIEKAANDAVANGEDGLPFLDMLVNTRRELAVAVAGADIASDVLLG